MKLLRLCRFPHRKTVYFIVEGVTDQSVKLIAGMKNWETPEDLLENVHVQLHDGEADANSSLLLSNTLDSKLSLNPV